MPGLLRARRRLRPGQRADQGAPRRRRVGDRRAEGVDVASPTSPTGASCSPAPSPARERHHGLSFLLVPMDQDGVEVRPIEQLTGGSEFNEVFFTGARTAADLVVGEPGDGWRVAMGAARLRARRLHARPAGRLRPRARRARRAGPRNGSYRRPGDPRPAGAGAGRARGDAAQRAAHALARGRRRRRQAQSIAKLVWAGWHRTLGELAMDVRRRRTALTAAARDVRPRRVAAAVPLHPRRHDLRRRPTRSSATSSPSACSACPRETQGSRR